MATLRVTVISENTAYGPGLLAEHGLAYWIETDSCYVLFDTGQGAVLAHNASRMGVPFHKVGAVVLSHGHYDHTGGLVDTLSTSPRAALYAHPAAFQPKFIKDTKGGYRDVGIPFAAKQAVQEHAEVPVETERPTLIAPGLTVTGRVPRVTDFEDTGGEFYLDSAGREPDPLEDDQSVFFESDAGTVVLLGCAHAGVINTLQYVRQLTGDRPIHAVLGGMHLVAASPERVKRTIEALRYFDVQYVGPAHCTGAEATAALWHALPGRCVACHAGARFEFETT